MQLLVREKEGKEMPKVETKAGRWVKRPQRRLANRKEPGIL